MAKPKITRIKAREVAKGDENEVVEAETKSPIKIKTAKEAKKAKKAARAEKAKEAKKAKKLEKAKKPDKKIFILFRPFVALFRYIRDAWKEIRQVRWPNRKTTWKMVLAVFVYTLLFVVIISLLDLFFSWLFNLILGN